MAPEHVFVANLCSVVMVLLVMGLVLTRRYRLSRFFFAYILAVLVADRLIVAWPETFYAAWFWTLKENVFAVFKMAIALELGLLTFSEFPRARRLFLSIVAAAAAAVAVLAIAPARLQPGDAAIGWVSAVVTREQAGLLYVLASVIAIAAYYRVPFHPFHRGVVLGFALYLVAFTGSVALLRAFGASFWPVYAALDPAAYASTVGVWTWYAWRALPAPSARLQPWAAASLS